jgi:hypothetical protein
VLHPPIDRHVIHPHAAFGQEFFDVAVGQPVAQYQRTATVITSGGKRNPANADLGSGVAGRRRIRPPCPTCDPPTQL